MQRQSRSSALYGVGKEDIRRQHAPRHAENTRYFQPVLMARQLHQQVIPRPESRFLCIAPGDERLPEPTIRQQRCELLRLIPGAVAA